MSVNLSADEILALTVPQARRRFGEKEIRRLLKRWHPDVNKDPRAGEVMAWLMTIKARLLTPDMPREYPCLLGKRIVKPGMFTLVFSKEPDLADTFVSALKRIPFADSTMRRQMELSLPRKVKRDEVSGVPCVSLPSKNMALLSDWVAVHGVPEPEHMAWIGSGLLNIAAWAEWAGWALPGISIDSVGIDPAKHQVHLFFGWESATPFNQRPLVVPDRVLSLFPAIAAPGQSLPSQINQELVAQTLRDLAGDPAGQDLTGLPDGMRSWLRAPAYASAREAYKEWHSVLEGDFGPRRFVKWAKTVDEVYWN